MLNVEFQQLQIVDHYQDKILGKAIKFKEKNHQFKDPLITQDKDIVPNVFESLKSEVLNIRISTMTDQWENTIMNADSFY